MNKLVLVSDLHIGKPQPKSRLDDFKTVHWDKFRQVVDIAEDNDGVILQAGDFFDSVNTPKEIISDVIRLLRKKRVKIYTVLGQHDCYMHSLTLVRRTPSYLLESAGVAKIVINPVLLKSHNVKLYGWSFGQGKYLGKPEFKDYNIMLTHQPIGDTSPSVHYAIISAKNFIREYEKFDLILCGDFHYPYTFSRTIKNHEQKDRYIVNTGCLIRKDTMRRELTRDIHVQILDIKNRELTKKVLDYAPAKTILNLATKGESFERINQSLTELIKKLNVEAGTEEISFKTKLMKWYRGNHTISSVQNYIAEAMSVCEGEVGE